MAQITPTPHTTKRFGSAQFEADTAGVLVRFGGRDWKMDLSRLPLSPSDCPGNPEASKNCANPHQPCLTCIRSWEPVAWDEPREIFYIAAAMDIGQNKPWIIFAFELRSGRLMRIGIDETGGFNGAAVSPSGKYLAYVGYAVCGVCCTTSDLRLIDTESFKTGTFSLPGVHPGGLPRILAVRWAGASTIEYDAQILKESDCRNGKMPEGSSTGSVQVAQILERH